MSSFKKLKTSDVITIPYIANKEWNFTFSTSSLLNTNANIHWYGGMKVTSSFDPSSDPIDNNASYKRMIYDSINHMFYQQYTDQLNTSSLASSLFYDSASEQRPTSSYYNYDYNDSIIKIFPTGFGEEIRVLSISRNLFGTSMNPSTFRLNASTLYDIRDDKNGNIIDILNDNIHVGNIFYALGIVVVTNQDYKDIIHIEPQTTTTTTTTTTTEPTTTSTTTTTTEPTTTSTTTTTTTTTTSTTTTTTTLVPSIVNYVLTEQASPYVDINSYVKDNGTVVRSAFITDSGSVSILPGHTITFEIESPTTSSAAGPMIYMNITKNSISVFNNSIAATSGSILTHNETAGAGDIYSFIAYSDSGATINFANSESIAPYADVNLQGKNNAVINLQQDGVGSGSVDVSNNHVISFETYSEFYSTGTSPTLYMTVIKNSSTVYNNTGSASPGATHLLYSDTVSTGDIYNVSVSSNAIGDGGYAIINQTGLTTNYNIRPSISGSITSSGSLVQGDLIDLLGTLTGGASSYIEFLAPTSSFYRMTLQPATAFTTTSSISTGNVVYNIDIAGVSTNQGLGYNSTVIKLFP